MPNKQRKKKRISIINIMIYLAKGRFVFLLLKSNFKLRISLRCILLVKHEDEKTTLNMLTC